MMCLHLFKDEPLHKNSSGRQCMHEELYTLQAGSKYSSMDRQEGRVNRQ